MLITNGSGVLQAWTAERGAFDQDFSRGALIGRALEGQSTEGLWLEPGEQGGREERDGVWRQAGAARIRLSPDVGGQSPCQQKEQRHIQRMQNDVGDVETNHIAAAPRCVVERV